MATETEIKLSLPERAAKQLGRHVLLSGVQPQRQLLINTYYDTPDCRLRSERLVVRYRQKGDEWLLGVKTAAQLSGGLAQRKEWECAGRPGEFDFSHVDQSSVRELLDSLRDQLQPAFVTRFERAAWLLEPRNGVRIELALDRGTIEAAGRRQPICEVELELVSGSIGDLFDLAVALQASLPLHPEGCSKSDRAYRLMLGTPMTAAKAQAVPIEAGVSSISAFQRIALSCVNQLQSNEKGILETDAPEFVHQARVAIRRLRSAMRVWQRQLPAPFASQFNPLWQEFARGLGEARNWDVFLADTAPGVAAAFADPAEIEPLLGYARSRCTSCRQAVRVVFKSAAYSHLLLDFTAALQALPEAKFGPLGDFVPAWLDKCTKRVNQRAAEAQSGDDEARHRLRLAFKQLRYALEFFSPLFAGPVLQDYHQSLTALQEQLGRQNDLAVAMQLAAEGLSGRDAELVQAWLAAQSDALLPELETLLAAFRRQGAPWLAPAP
jgi:triphosphatase